MRFYALAVSETSVAVPAPYPSLVTCPAERPPPSPTFSSIFGGVFSAFLSTVAEASEPPTADVWWRRTAHRFLKFSAPLGPSAMDPPVANIDQYALGHHTGWGKPSPVGTPYVPPQARRLVTEDGRAPQVLTALVGTPVGTSPPYLQGAQKSSKTGGCLSAISPKSVGSIRLPVPFDPRQGRQPRAVPR